MKLSLSSLYGSINCKGEIEFIFRDIFKNVISSFKIPNIVKIFGKEILAHRLAPDRIWDPSAASGTGAWVTTNPTPVLGTDDPVSDFGIKYMLFGASFDDDGVALGTNDSRYYTVDSVTSRPVPIKLEPGADYNGDLINPIRISEPGRPLKKIESVSFESTYQPTGTPFLMNNVRSVNNIVVFETTLTIDEYNGMGTTSSDSFTITEVALAAGKEFGSVGSCECTPRELFLEGDNGVALKVNMAGTDVVSLDPSVTDIDLIRQGDQICLTAMGATPTTLNDLDQISQYYLVVSKLAGGYDIVLDRIPKSSNGTALTGTAGVFKDTLRIFSHRVLPTPVSKNSVVEVVCRWRVILS